MWICPICKTTNETNKCRSCGFDKSKDYTNHRSLCMLSKSGSKIFKPAQPGDNILMASSDTDYVFGRKMDRKQITTIYFRNKKENIDEDAWDVSEKRNGSIMAWTEEKRNGFVDLYLAANGNILANKDCSMLFRGYENLKKFVGLQYFRTDQTEDMHSMFSECIQLKTLNLKKMDTGNVTNMSHMFYLCLHLQSLNLEKLHTDQVTDMSAMFALCSELKELDLSSFGTSNVKNMNMMFFHCKNLEKLNISSFNTSNVERMAEMFTQCESLGELDVSHFDTSKIENMPSFSEYTKLPDNVTLKSSGNILMASYDLAYIFGRKMERKQIAAIYFQNKKENIGKDAWDVSEKQDGSIMAWTEQKENGLLDLYIAANGNITANRNCKDLFCEYSMVKKIGGLEFLKTDQTETMIGMFDYCKNLLDLDVSHFSTSQVTNMSRMFSCCRSLISLDVSHFDTSQVTDMQKMFKECNSLKTLDVSNFDTSSVENLAEPLQKYLAVPQGVCLKIKEPEHPGDNVLMASSDEEYVFGRKMDRSKIGTVHFLNSKGKGGEDAWDVSEKQNGSIMAWTEEKEDGLLDLYIAANGNIIANRDCSHLFSKYSMVKKIEGLEFLKTNQTENMEEMFGYCENLLDLDMSRFGTGQATKMGGMFDYCKSLTSLDVSHFDTSRVTYMRRMFCGCKSLASLDVSYFDTSHVPDMSWMFDGCNSLENLDVSHFDTSQVTNMFRMFSCCWSLKSLDVNHFDTSQVTDMSRMFSYCESLKSLDVSHFDTSQVTRLLCMFCSCESLASLDVSHFDTSQVVDMYGMFGNCGSLASLDVSHFNTSQVSNMQDMFYECKSLKILDVSNFDTSNVKDLSVPLPEYLAVPQGVRLKTKKTNSFFHKLWEKLSN